MTVKTHLRNHRRHREAGPLQPDYGGHTPPRRNDQPTSTRPATGDYRRNELYRDPDRGNLVVLTRRSLVGVTSGYDAFNRLTSSTDVNGVLTETVYDDPVTARFDRNPPGGHGRRRPGHRVAIRHLRRPFQTTASGQRARIRLRRGRG